MIPSLIAPLALLAAQAATPPVVDAVDMTQVGNAVVPQPAGTAESQPPIIVPPPSPAVPAEGAEQAPAATDDIGADEVKADEVKVDRDPLEGFNRAMFSIHQAMDKRILRPAAMGYRQVVPKPVRSGVRNLLSNLTEPFIFVNFLLQAKPGKAAETLARFMVNSTLGIAGLFDIAKRKDFNLPHRPNGFGTTLAIYGVKSGPYLFLPLIGPTTLRDVLGKPADEGFLPLTIGKPFTSWEYQFSTGLVSGLDMRAEADVELRALFGDAVDPYATLRSVYLQNRAAEIEETRGRPSIRQGSGPSELGDPLNDPAELPTAGK